MSLMHKETFGIKRQTLQASASEMSDIKHYLAVSSIYKGCLLVRRKYYRSCLKFLDLEVSNFVWMPFGIF